MATRKNKLTTVFDADDRPFQKKIKRVQQSAKKTSAIIGKMGGILAGVGVSASLNRTVKYFDRIGKLATRMNMSAESLQKLSHAADLSGASIEQLQGIMTRLERRTGEALQNASGSQAQRFRELNIEVEAFSQLSPENKIMAIADAFNALGGSEKSIASLMGLLDTEVRELLPLLKLGSDGINDLVKDVQTLTGEQVKQMEAATDAITKFQQATTVAFGQSLIGLRTIIDGFKFAIPGTREFKHVGLPYMQAPKDMTNSEFADFAYEGIRVSSADRRLMEKHKVGDLRIARKREELANEQKRKFEQAEKRSEIKDFSQFKKSMGGFLESRFSISKIKQTLQPHKFKNLKESGVGFIEDLGSAGKTIIKNNKERARMENFGNLGIFAGFFEEQERMNQSQTSGRFGEFIASATLGSGRGRSVSQSRGIRIQGLDKSVLIQEAMKKALEDLVANTTER
tara:strand:- start:841 stop:2208 length:1368 start_codon:yes stop_codon:yes gene_type:complete